MSGQTAFQQDAFQPGAFQMFSGVNNKAVVSVFEVEPVYANVATITPGSSAPSSYANVSIRET